MTGRRNTHRYRCTACGCGCVSLCVCVCTRVHVCACVCVCRRPSPTSKQTLYLPPGSPTTTRPTRCRKICKRKSCKENDCNRVERTSSRPEQRQPVCQVSFGCQEARHLCLRAPGVPSKRHITKRIENPLLDNRKITRENSTASLSTARDSLHGLTS